MRHPLLRAGVLAGSVAIALATSASAGSPATMGPQLCMAMPAASIPEIRMGSAPAITVFQDRLYLAFQANDASHTLFISSTEDGESWATPATGYKGIKIGGTPSLTIFEYRLYLAFQADDDSHTLFVTSTADGKDWTTPAIGYAGIKTGSTPALATFRRGSYVVFQADDSTHVFHVTSANVCWADRTPQP